MIQGFTLFSFSMKSVMSTTRSRITGKYRSGSTTIGPESKSRRNVEQVSRGSPFTIIPQDPHTPILHDHRYARLPSRWSLMWFRASSTTMSSVRGTWNSSKYGSGACSGR